MVFKKNGKELLEAALAYAALGMKVFPCHTPVIREGKQTVCSCNKDCGANLGKHPRSMHGSKDATSDVAKITSWWKTFPFANIGIATGDGTFAVDLDTKHNGPEHWQALVDANGGSYPDTAECITGSGGRHIYFRSPEGMKIQSSASKIAPGVDIRGDGGYVIAPPSLHMSGNHYTWELSSDPLDGHEIVAAPDWLIALLVPKSDARAATIANDRGKISEGGRNEALFSMGRSMRSRGASAETIKAALFTANETQCDPPISDPKEIDTIVAQVCKVPAGLSDEVKQKLATKAQAKEQKSLPAAQSDLERGDHAELADLLIDALVERSKVRPIYDRGDIWCFSQENSLWEIIPTDRLIGIVSGFAGLTVSGMPLKIRFVDIRGIIEIAKASVYHSGFFNNAPQGIAFKNGFVRIDDNGAVSIEPLVPEHRAVTMLPFDYDPDAPSERWDSYLREIFTLKGEQLIANKDDRETLDVDREARIAMLQEHAGACLLGTITQYAIALVLTGEGANGKSVYLSVIRSLFPKSSLVSISPQDWENKFYLAELAGAKLNAVNELPDKEIIDSEAFKAVVSGDPIMVARKRERPFQLHPQAGHLFACNALPNARDQSEGMWRRFIVVPFDRIFAPQERDITLADKIIASELPGVAAWAVAGAASLRARGSFDLAESSRIVQDEWRLDSDQVRQWVQECTAPGGHLGAKVAYAVYREWAKKVGHLTMTERKFQQRLSRVLQQRRSARDRFYERTIVPEYMQYTVV